MRARSPFNAYDLGEFVVTSMIGSPAAGASGVFGVWVQVNTGLPWPLIIDSVQMRESTAGVAAFAVEIGYGPAGFEVPIAQVALAGAALPGGTTFGIMRNNLSVLPPTIPAGARVAMRAKSTAVSVLNTQVILTGLRGDRFSPGRDASQAAPGGLVVPFISNSVGVTYTTLGMLPYDMLLTHLAVAYGSAGNNRVDLALGSTNVPLGSFFTVGQPSGACDCIAFRVPVLVPAGAQLRAKVAATSIGALAVGGVRTDKLDVPFPRYDAQQVF